MRTASVGERPTQDRRRTAWPLWLCAGAVGVSLALRILYLVQPWRIDMSEHPAFIAAEGVVGLMARHILHGEWPVFYYGQAYMGALEGYAAALLFSAFGSSMTALRSTPMLFALAWIPLAFGIARRLYGKRAALLAAALVALPSQFVFVWGFEARGGHAEHVALTLATLYLLVRSLEHASPGRLMTLGFVIGLSLWVNQLAFLYLPIYGYVLLKWLRLQRRQWVGLAVSALIGISPLIYGNIVQPLGTARVLGAKVHAAVAFGRRQPGANDGGEPKFYRAVPLPQVLGAQPRRDGAWSSFGVLAALFLTLGALGAARSVLLAQGKEQAARHGVLAVLGATAATVVLSIAGFSGQPIGRYLLVLYPLLCVLAAGWWESIMPRWAVPAVALVVLVQAAEIVRPGPVDARTAPATVVAALEEHGLRYGYSADYMYDAVFESGERVIIEPLEWTRYPPYKALVAAADHIFYVYRDDQNDKPANLAFLSYLAKVGIHYRKFRVGEYNVLYDFDPRELLSPTAIAEIAARAQRKKGAPPRHAPDAGT